MIAGEDLTVSLGRTVIIDDVSIEIPDRGTLGLVGPNGSGKTTLIRTLYGALTPDAGAVTLDGRPLRDYPRKQLAQRLAVVGQEHPGDLPMSVVELVMLGRLPHQGFSARPTAGDERIVAEALAEVGVLHLAQRDFQNLSGGERQRVLIARALAQGADHILLDEPTNHLDIRYQHEVLDLVTRLPSSATVVLHDLNLAARYCDHIIVLNHGRIVAHGTPEEVLTPAILEPIYGVRVRRIDLDGSVNLLFSKATDQETA